MASQIKNKKAQITIFIILALIIVVVVLLLLIFFKKIGPKTSIVDAKNPQIYIDNCVKEKVNELSDKILENGGYVVNPPLIKNYLGKNIAYLCYVNKNYARCIPREPVLIEHLHDEIYNYTSPFVEQCFENLQKELEKDNYLVSLSPETNLTIELVPDKIKIKIKKEIKISKTGKERKFKTFKTETQTSLYNFGILIHEIIKQESLYCNSNYVNLMRLNKRFDIDRFQTSDKDVVYTITDSKTNKETQFAVRGCIMAPIV